MLERVILLDAPRRRLDDLADALKSVVPAGCAVERAATPRSLLALVRKAPPPSLVLLSEAAAGSDRDPRRLVPRLRERLAGLPVVVVADQGSVDGAARAVEAGASDFLVRAEPLAPRVETLLGKLRGLFEAVERTRVLDEQNAALRTSVQARFDLVGESKAMQRLLDRIQRVALVPRPVLVTGERGSGKELVARAIHFAGGPATRPIVTVNCAAFSDPLLESELFGHERGAFTGADTTRRGKFEQANGGTLFLDEIGNMSLPFQQKILRVVEYGTFHRVGGAVEQKTTARVIAATNVDLKARMRQGEFLRDLYDRLSFDVLEVPALRDRKGDVAVLARHFLHQFAREIPAFRGKTLTPGALEALERYPFPGNVRELKNIIERAAYRDTDPIITASDLGLLAADEAVGDTGGPFQARVDGYRRRLLLDALAQASGNQAEAARLLGLAYHQFRYFHARLVAKAS
jgi:DNA-binding NtrC family response regulator